MQLENMIGEVAYKNYATTGELIEEINFEKFVKLYINHRPAFGVALRAFKNAFQTFGNPKEIENPILTRQNFLNVLFGKVGSDNNGELDGLKLYGLSINQKKLNYIKINRAEVSDIYSDANFFLFFIDLSCLNFNNNRCKIRPTFLNAISCSKSQKLTRN